jgi:hypothetical protein
MAKRTGHWFRWGAIGCGGTVLVLLITFLVTTLLTGVGYDRAIEARADLEQRFDTQADFTPDGTLGADRLQRFLEVRRSLQPLCAMVSQHQELFSRFAGTSPQEERTFVDVLRDVRQALGVPFLVGRDFGDYVTRRNKVLLANEMGLGEYTWIYVTAYHSWLGHSPARVFPTADRPGVYEQRVNRQVREMIERHVADGMPPDLESWQAELAALAADPTRIAFEDGVPPALEAALEPYRAELEQMYCPAAGELEVVLTVESGAWFDHR